MSLMVGLIILGSNLWVIVRVIVSYCIIELALENGSQPIASYSYSVENAPVTVQVTSAVKHDSENRTD